jgi:photosystem II stability/assembly factor-like uncharacterized protein
MVSDMNVSAQSPKRYLILVGLIGWNLVLLFVLGTALVSQAQQSRITSVGLRDSPSLYRGTTPVTVTSVFTYYFPLVFNNYTPPTWTFLGPDDVPIRQVAVAETATLYAVLDFQVPITTSIYKSDNDGLSWTPSSSGLLGRVQSLYVHPLTPTMLLAGTLTGGRGIHHSDDGGQYWIDAGLDPFIRVVAAHPTTPTLWLAASYNSLIFGSAYVYRTENAGASWETVIPTTTVIDSFAFDLDDPNRVYACAWSGFLSSSDAGLTWSYGGPDSCGELMTDPYTHTILYAVNGSGVLKTEDKGLSWTQIFTGEYSYWALAVDQLKPSTIYAATLDELFRSVDAGRSWQQLPLPIEPGPVRISDLAVGRSGKLFMATDHGVWSFQ